MADQQAADEKSLDERLATLTANKEKRDAVRALEGKKRKLAELELEEKLEQEIGARGVDFQIINTEVGLIAVKLGDFLVYKRFDAIPLDKRSAEDVIAFVTPCVVVPPRPQFGELVTTRPGIAYSCALAILNMFAGKKDEATGKS